MKDKLMKAMDKARMMRSMQEANGVPMHKGPENRKILITNEEVANNILKKNQILTLKVMGRITDMSDAGYGFSVVNAEIYKPEVEEREDDKSTLSPSA